MKMKKAFIILGGAAAVLVAALTIFVLTFDINSYRSDIETAVSRASGMDVKIKGKMNLSVFPPGISARDIHVANAGEKVLSLERLNLGAELKPLLQRRLEVKYCELIKPVLLVVRSAAGKYNFNAARKAPEKRKAFSLNEFRLSEGELVYIDRKTGARTEFKDLNLDIKDFSTAGSIMKDASFTGSFDCREIIGKNFKVEKIRGPVKASGGVFYLTPLSLELFGAKGEGDITIDKSSARGLYKINLKLPKLDFVKLEESLGTKKIVGGKGDLHASLTLTEGRRNLINGTDGTFSLTGDNLIIYTMDLDKVLSSYESSQKFNLVDVGAFLIAGPLSTAALKGYRYGDFYHKTRGGRGSIKKFVSHWKIRSGVAEAGDCALATENNRIALKGKLNLVNKQYENVVVALLDEKGCAKFKQGISGPFSSPRIGAVSTIKSFAGPIFDLFRKTRRFISGGNCEVFYNGAVTHRKK